MTPNPYLEAKAKIAEIDARIAERIAANEVDAKDRADWQIVMRVYRERYAPDDSAAEESEPAKVSVEHMVPRYRLGSNKHLIYLALKHSQNPWLTAQEIQAIASDASGRDIPMSSISPSLSDMRTKEKLIVRDGLKVALADRKDEAPSNAGFSSKLTGLLEAMEDQDR